MSGSERPTKQTNGEHREPLPGRAPHGPDREDAETPAIRIGIAGCGALGVVHASRFAAIPGVQVAAVCDPSAEARRRAAQAAGAANAFSTADYDEMLRADLDAVCIATPDGFHVPQALAALDRGLHVLCEKPLTPHAEELERVIAAANRAQRVVTMTYPRRHDGGLRAMRREIRSGRWGRVQTVTVYFAEDWMTPCVGTWRHDPALCPGGFFYDSNGHQLDTLFWLTGLEGVTVRAHADNRGTRVPIWVWGVARLTGDVPLTFSFVGDAKVLREHIMIHCEGRDFRVENLQARWFVGNELAPIEPPEPGENADDALIRLIRGGGGNWAPLEELWPVLRFTRAALASAESGEETVV